jgi:hypothetical protein
VTGDTNRHKEENISPNQWANIARSTTHLQACTRHPEHRSSLRLNWQTIEDERLVRDDLQLAALETGDAIVMR